MSRGDSGLGGIRRFLSFSFSCLGAERRPGRRRTRHVKEGYVTLRTRLRLTGDVFPIEVSSLAFWE